MTSKANGRGGSRPGAGRKPATKSTEIKPAKNQTPGEASKRGGARPGAGRKPKQLLAEPAKNQTAPKSGQRGGARSGAGRKPKAKSEQAAQPKIPAIEESLEPQAHGGALKRRKERPVEISERDMLTLLQDVALGRIEASGLRVRAAIAAVQYTHVKKGDGGKKDEQAEKAKRVASRFTPGAPPKLVAAGGKKV
ncbi:hypothetical protein ACLKMY_00505 [Paraburkholderia mimosarum]|uniref:hypothetical protein n=1 Tax=Paraburkholderia mimosarum TaxID=312026 RepID=UPI0039C4D841